MVGRVGETRRFRFLPGLTPNGFAAVNVGGSLTTLYSLRKPPFHCPDRSVSTPSTAPTPQRFDSWLCSAA